MFSHYNLSELRLKQSIHLRVELLIDEKEWLA